MKTYALAVITAMASTMVVPTLAHSAAAVSATIPVFPGWYNGKIITYLATDASDKAVAKSFGANYVPQLANAALSSPKSVDDIYTVTNFDQTNIIPSAPQPLGPKNTNMAYTPLWQVTTVTWNFGVPRHTLTSERAVLKAAAAGHLTLSKTNIVVNCSVIQTPSGTLPNTTINFK